MVVELALALLALAQPALPLSAGRVAGSFAPAQSPLEQDTARAEAAKRERLARDFALLEDLLARQRSAAGRSDALGAMRNIIDASKEKSVPDRNYLKLSDGWVKGSILRFVDAWNAPSADGRAVPALDLNAPGHPFGAIVDFARQLEENGIDLLVVPVPNRLDVYADELLLGRQIPGFAGYDSGTTALLVELSRSGVEILSLNRSFLTSRNSLPALGLDSLYLRFNNHWSPRAAEIAAGAIAERILELPGLERGSEREGEQFFLVADELDWAPERVEDYMFDFRPERLQLRRVLDAKGEPAARWDRDSPVLVLGDSFAVFFQKQSADLLSHLYAQLGFAVDAIAIPGSAAAASRAVIRRRGDALAGQRVVVWTFAVTAFEYNEWKRIDVFGE